LGTRQTTFPTKRQQRCRRCRPATAGGQEIDRDGHAEWLKYRDDKLSILANRLGYQSEAAFARRFKEFHGVWPGEFRRAG